MRLPAQDRGNPTVGRGVGARLARIATQPQGAQRAPSCGRLQSPVGYQPPSLEGSGLAASFGATLAAAGLARRELRDLFGKLGRVDAGIGLGLLDDDPRCTS